MSLNLTFKQCDESDLPTLWEIEQQMKDCPLFCVAADQEEFGACLKQNTFFIIYKADEVAGYCAYGERNKDLAEIHSMAILKQFRRKGIGTQALEMMLEKLRDYKTIMVFTHPENNNSLRLYLKHGFVIKEWRENYFGNQPRLALYKENS